LLPLSAKTPAALEVATDNLGHYLQQHPDQDLADVAYTLQAGRRTFDYRRTVVCRSVDDAAAALQARDSLRVLSSVQGSGDRPIAFMFSGLGNHYVDMALGLYQAEPVFREHIDRCSELLKADLDLDLREVLYPSGTRTAGAAHGGHSTSLASPTGLDLRRMLYPDEPADDATQHMIRTSLVQPALFTVEYGLAQLWMHWGVLPQALIGYSLGEYMAVCLAGVFSLEDALHLVAQRAQLIQALPNGAMLAVPLSERQVYPLLGRSLCLAAINGPSLCVVSGPTEAVVALERVMHFAP
jgi:acyl transferase domain-containing protein